MTPIKESGLVRKPRWAQGKPLQLVDGEQLREWLAIYLDIVAH